MPNISVWTTSGGLQHSKHVTRRGTRGGIILRNQGSIPSESRQERDYLLVVRDLASQFLINFCKLAKRFTDYLKLPLNSRLQQCTLEVIVERLSGYELRNEI
jgi:hypothetical protein